MNETYPNISVNSVRLSSDSCALEEEGASTKSAESPRGEREESTCEQRVVRFVFQLVARIVFS